MSEAVTVQMPQLDQEMKDGAVVQWLKAEGDPVAQGEVIAEIETDKAIVEVEAPASGVVRSIDVPAGEVVPVGTTLAVIEGVDAEAGQPSDAETPLPTASIDDDEYEIPLSSMRRTIASRTSRSMREAPHFYVITEIDMTRATEFRREYNKELPQGVRVSVNDLIIKASALAINKYPAFNSYFKDNRLISSPHVNIGIAIALDEGLVIPAILDCQDRDLVNISKASRDLIRRAHGGALKAPGVRRRNLRRQQHGDVRRGELHRHHLPTQRGGAGHRVREREAGGKEPSNCRWTDDEGYAFRRPPGDRRGRGRPVPARGEASVGTPRLPESLSVDAPRLAIPSARFFDSALLRSE